MNVIQYDAPAAFTERMVFGVPNAGLHSHTSLRTLTCFIVTESAFLFC